MIKIDVQNLQPWKEALTRLSENHFLDLVRMYVGVIKTPYNKERLINELIAFLHKAENRQKLTVLLSENDIMILNAVTYISNVDREKLTTFFSEQFSIAVLYEYLMNLEERLILFRPLNEKTGKDSFAINPLLKELINPLLDISVLFPLPLVAQVESSDKAMRYEDSVPHSGQGGLSARLLVSWFAFIAENPSACRADGSFKKKTLEQIAGIFHGVSVDFLLKLNTSLVNLVLFLQDGNNFVPNEGKWRSFSILPSKVQYAYIVAASYSRIPRDTLVKYAIFASSLASSIPKEGYTRSILLRLAFLLQEKQTAPVKPRSKYFSKILEKATNNQKSSEGFSHEALIDAMLLFGLLSISGKNAKDEDIIVCSQKDVISSHELDSTDNAAFSSPNEKVEGSISIDAGFTVTLLRELPLSNLFDLVQCMDLASFDTVCRFTITRSACMRCFDRGVNTQDIFHALEKSAGDILPQNLTFSIEEWHSAYNAGSLFKGYVLQVSPDKQVHVENNPILAPYIRMTLVPGIYLLNFAGDEDAVSAIQKSGLDFIGMPKNLHTEQESLPFANFLQSSQSLPMSKELNEKNMEEVSTQNPNDYAKNTANLHNDAEKAHRAEMEETLEMLNLSPDQKEGLLLRIERKIILNPTQLKGDSVRVEKTEASGMDFVGKVYVIEQAIASSNMIEVTTGSTVYFGLPTGISKRTGDATVTMILENEQETVTFSIGQARLVKRFRGSIFKEKR